MALIQETQWHGNPRPFTSYAWSEETAGVITYGVTGVPYAEKDDDPSGATDVAGPAAVVEVSLAGPMPAGTLIDYGFVGDVTPDSSGLYNVPVDASPEKVVAAFVAGLNWSGAVAQIKEDNPRVIQLTAAGGNTTVGVTAWNVTPPA